MVRTHRQQAMLRASTCSVSGGTFLIPGLMNDLNYSIYFRMMGVYYEPEVYFTMLKSPGLMLCHRQQVWVSGKYCQHHQIWVSG